jgi:hypothetical protein
VIRCRNVLRLSLADRLGGDEGGAV